MIEMAAGALLAIGLALWGWLRGAAAARRDREAEDARAYRDAMQSAQGADVGRGDADDDREWLRRRGQ